MKFEQTLFAQLYREFFYFFADQLYSWSMLMCLKAALCMKNIRALLLLCDGTSGEKKNGNNFV